MKYSHEKINENKSYVWHTEGDKKTIIAITADIEKAHFLATAANQYKEPESNPGEQGQEESLREAAEAVMKSWSERMNNEVEEYKENKERGGYWSPSASMVDSSAINQLRTALAGDGQTII